MFADEDDCTAAADFFCRILAEDVVPVKILVSRIGRAPSGAKRYLQRRCRDVHKLEEFFADNSHLFFLENGRVATQPEEFQVTREEAAWYFKKKLECYPDPVHFQRLKMEHIGSAPANVASFITRFYPVKDFKHFLRSRPDLFVVYPDSTVFLIETETVAHYERALEYSPEKKLPFLRLRGHVGQAPQHIRQYVNRYYPGDDFQIFLRNHNDVFVLDDELNAGTFNWHVASIVNIMPYTCMDRFGLFPV